MPKNTPTMDKSRGNQGAPRQAEPAGGHATYKTSDSQKPQANLAEEIFERYHVHYKSPSAKMVLIRKGIEAVAIKDFIRLTGVTQVDLAHILSLTEPTLRKYINEGKALNQGITEHIIQLFELFDKGMDTFGSLEQFKNWLPHHNIGINARPIDLLDTITGINIVMTELHRIDYGILA
jgi:putative toxin-antitoxin system antitoxin component (TIGR02293 family)